MEALSIVKLRDEHRTFDRSLAMLNQQLTAADLDLDVALDLAFFAIRGPDVFHHPKEDEVMRYLLGRRRARDLERHYAAVGAQGGKLIELLHGFVLGPSQIIARTQLLDQAQSHRRGFANYIEHEEGEFFPTLAEAQADTRPA